MSYSPPGWAKPIGLFGICSVCLEPVSERDKFSHPCPNYHVSYGWSFIVNPRQEPWIPGYRFSVVQPSKRGRRNYKVIFLIDADGLIRHIGGTKPTPRTLEIAENAYARGRPGSNCY